MNWLHQHPFAVEAHFEHSVVFTYAFPSEVLQTLLPPGLQVDRWQEKWGFAAIALVKTKRLRPKGWPAFLGRDFILAGTRIFCRYTDSRGKNLRGLYILQSETDSRCMAVTGNLMTRYNYRYSDIDWVQTGSEMAISSAHTGWSVKVSPSMDAPLPAHSPFSNWSEARRFAGPLPHTFTYLKKSREMLIVEGVRQNWMPTPAMVHHENMVFPEPLNSLHGRLANAFIVSDIPYYWKKGRKDRCNT